MAKPGRSLEYLRSNPGKSFTAEEVAEAIGEVDVGKIRRQLANIVCRQLATAINSGGVTSVKAWPVDGAVSGMDAMALIKALGYPVEGLPRQLGHEHKGDSNDKRM